MSRHVCVCVCGGACCLIDKTRAYVFEVIEGDGRLDSLKELLVDHHREVNVQDDAVVDGQPKDLESVRTSTRLERGAERCTQGTRLR
jgi:hypothetical protein